MGAEFRVLGEVEVVVDGRRLDIGHARQRFVLACLLVDANRAVTADQLIDRVWADEAPQRARNALAAYVSRLRQVLAPTGATIGRGAGGYTLTVDPDSVDMHRFRRGIASARSSGDPNEAAAEFERALALCQGELFASLDTPWATDCRSTVEAERFSAFLDRNELALNAGRHAELLVELAAAWEAHPVDERLAGQLMSAQYRSGRQADALAVYATMRKRLADDLGVDPSPLLQAVYQTILDGDAHPPAGRPALSTGRLRAGVPRRPTRLVGRDDDVRRAVDAVRAAPLVTLTGVGGVGKTRLALEVADREQERRDEVWICELASVGDSGAVGHAVATALRVHRRHDQDVGDAVMDYLRSADGLLLLDNCEHVLPGVAELVDRITRESARVTVLATSREPLSVDGEHVYPVRPLADEDAVTLFAERAKASRPDFDPSNEPVGAVAEICRRLDGVPLAIELAAARMRAMGSLDVARRLDRLRLLSGGTRGAHPRQQSVTATIDWSYRLLSGDEQTLFTRLSVFVGGFDLEAAHRVCGEPTAGEDDTLELLTGLVDKSMVVVRGGATSSRYLVLETLRAYGRERLQENGAAQDLERRHASYFVDLLHRFDDGMRGADEQAWVQRMTPGAQSNYAAPDFDNIRAAFEYVMGVGDRDRAMRVAVSLLDLMNRVGYHSGSTWASRVVDTADPSHPLYAAAVGVAARSAMVNAEFGRAIALASMAIGQQVPPGTHYLAYPGDVRADAEGYVGDPRRTLEHHLRELPDVRTASDRVRHVYVLDKITWSHQALGQPERGVPAAEEAVAVADATAKPTIRSLARCAMGRSLAESDPGRALRILREANDLATSVENNWLIGMALMESAIIMAAQEDSGRAAGRFVDVLDLWERGGPSMIAQQWDTLRHCSRLLLRLGAPGDAAAVHCAVVAAGLRSPITAAEIDGWGRPGEVPLTGVAAVELARTALRRYC